MPLKMSSQSSRDTSIDSSSGTNSNEFVPSKNGYPRRVIRQYLNSVLFIESSIFYDMGSFKSCPDFLNDKETFSKVVKVKRRACFKSYYHCHLLKFQFKVEENSQIRESELGKKVSPTSINQTSLKSKNEDSGITSQSLEVLKLPSPSFASSTTVRSDEEPVKKERSSCAEKDKEKKLQEEKKADLCQLEEEERETRFEQKREDFTPPLINEEKEEEKQRKKKEKRQQEDTLKEEKRKKKKEKQQQEETLKEEKRKKKKEKRQQDETLKEELKLKHFEENERNCQLKKRDESYVQKKFQKQIKWLQMEEAKRAQLKANVKACEAWLEQCKDNLGPISVNQVAQNSGPPVYVYLTPWDVILDIKPKPASQ